MHTHTASITLETPITRGDTVITELTLRKPAAGELRGVVLSELLRMEQSQVAAVLPRISTPTVTAHEVAQMDAADFMACAMEVADFLLPRALKQSAAGADSPSA